MSKEINWLRFEDHPLKQGDAFEISGNEEVIGHHPDWIDEDYNIHGVRIGIIDCDGMFHCAKWCSYHDTYEDEISEPPLYYHFILTKPLTQVEKIQIEYLSTQGQGERSITGKIPSQILDKCGNCNCLYSCAKDGFA